MEALDVGGVAGEAGVEDLDSDEAVRLGVERSGDRPLRPRGDLLEDPVAPYSFLRHSRCSPVSATAHIVCESRSSGHAGGSVQLQGLGFLTRG